MSTEPKNPKSGGLDEMQAKRAERRRRNSQRRKERDAENEIDSLNITPMMDMMTIILVFLLKSYSSTGITMNSDVSPPISTTRWPPKDTVAVTITRCVPDGRHVCQPGDGVVLVNDKTIFSYSEDRIPMEIKGQADSLLIPPLLAALQTEVDKSKKIAMWNPNAPFTGELSIIADRNMPYRVLTEILYTAGQAELNKYRFVVIQKDGGDS
ncbi:MAG: biopolymer transporter ExbD [Myxococcales bacterium]|jgi:biopolymer transport protein ExbD|nr:biopolymer transporter ExbD [Myxococcales bacterium]